MMVVDKARTLSAIGFLTWNLMPPKTMGSLLHHLFEEARQSNSQGNPAGPLILKITFARTQLCEGFLGGLMLRPF